MNEIRPQSTLESGTPRPMWLVLALVLTLATSAIGDATWLCHHNTLYRNGRWMSTKVQLGRYTMGALSFMVTRTALHDNRLNLGVWHGFHEILYRQPMVLAAAQYDCLLRPDTYVSLIFDRTDQGCKGVRLSLNQGYPNVYLEATPTGQFTRQIPLDVPVHRGWNHVRTAWRDGALWVTVNQGQPVSVPAGARAAGLCGFRGCLGDVAVDNVDFDPGWPAPHVRETFDNYASLPRLLACTFAIAALAMGGLFLALRHRSTAGPFLVTLNLWLLVVSLLGFGAEWFYFGPMHPRFIDFTQFPEYRNYVEAAPGAQAICQEIQQRYSGKPRGRRVMFVGSSQTWGSGARTEAETWVRDLERRLNAEHAAQGPFECINTGISGAISVNLEFVYLHQWIDLKPEVCVIDLAFNDPSPAELVKHVGNMLDENRRRGIKSLVVLEPACSEYPEPAIPAKREALRELAEREHVPYVQMQPWLNGHQQEGFLWWDMVHLTSFGQELFAQRLYAPLEASLGLQ